MRSILARASWQYLTQHSWQLVLGILGITLGVSVVVAVDLAKSSALSAFNDATQAIAGKATHRIIGGPTGIDETLYRQLRMEFGLQRLAPKIESAALIDGGDKEVLRLLGIDPFAEIQLHNNWMSNISGGGKTVGNILVEFLTEPGSIVLTTATAERMNLNPGDKFSAIVAGRRHQLSLVGLLSDDSNSIQRSLDDLVITDISSAQELTGMLGRISYIDLVVEDSDDLVDSLKDKFPKDIELIESGRGSRSMKEMTQAFYTNISALSLLSLIVGMFLIYNTMNFMVVQRRQLIGALRALGVTRSEIFRLIVLEAAGLGLIASLLGLVLGIILGGGLLILIEETLNAVYFSITSPLLNVSSITLVKGLLLGVGVTLISILHPAIQAIRIPPIQTLSRSQLETNSRRLSVVSGILGLVFFALGITLITWQSSSVILGFAAMFITILGCALMTPAVVMVTMKLVQRPLTRWLGLMGKMPVRFITASLSRTGVAMAALMVAIATTIGLELMIGSFRFSVEEWLDNRLNADLYVSPVGTGSSYTPIGLSPDLPNRIEGLAGVHAVATVRRISVQNENSRIRLNAVELPDIASQGFRFILGKPEEIWPQFIKSDAVIVSETFAYHHQLTVDSKLVLRTDSGDQEFRVVGIYIDYNAGRGVVTMSRASYHRYWHDRSISGIGVYLAQGFDISDLRQDISGLMTADQMYQLTDNRKIVDISLKIFDQAFIITDVLGWLASMIAFIGIISALMALQLDRVREFGTLRALGLTPRQLWLLITSETALMGVVSGIFALPVGALIATLLVSVVNQRTFGWTIDVLLEPAVLTKGLMLAIIAAVLAGLLPAYQMSKTRPAEALRVE